MEEVSRWIENLPRGRFFDVSKTGFDLPPEQIVTAMRGGVRLGLIERVYRITTPDGEVLPTNYFSIHSLPEEVVSDGKSFDLTDCGLIAGYVRQ